MGPEQPGIGPPLDAVSLDDLVQCYATGKKIQPQLAGVHAHLSVHVLDILNHAIGKHRSNRDSATPNSLLRVIQLWYLMPALLHSPDGRIKRRQRVASAENGDIIHLLPWRMAFTRKGDSRQRDRRTRTGVISVRGRGQSVVAPNVLAEPRPAGNEETWNTLVAKFPSQDHAAVSAAAVEVVLASVTDGEDGNYPPWRPDDEYVSEVLFDVINSSSALSGPKNGCQILAHLEFIIHTDIGREEFERGMTAFWRRVVEEPDVFPPEV